jgi:hypothetical protein
MLLVLLGRRGDQGGGYSDLGYFSTMRYTTPSSDVT